MPRRGTTTERGYGAEHQQLRAELLPWAYGRPCPRCGDLMHEGQELDLGHDDEDRAEYQGMEHATCNRSAGAAKGNRQRGQARPARRQLSVSAYDL
ncbi:hypothetical protein [Actinophytocola sediminis]